MKNATTTDKLNLMLADAANALADAYLVSLDWKAFVSVYNSQWPQGSAETVWANLVDEAGKYAGRYNVPNPCRSVRENHYYQMAQRKAARKADLARRGY